MKTLKYLILLALLILTVGCTQRVPVGYVGMVQTAGGLTGKVLAPGNHSCWGRDRMLLIEVSEEVMTEKMDILCQDDLNFKFDLKTRTQIASTDAKAVTDLFTNKGSAMKKQDIGYVLPFSALYTTYVKPQARAISRAVVSKHATTQIRENREGIEKSIKTDLIQAVKGTPVVIKMITTSNFDYPDIITTAMETKKQREVALKQEEANQALLLLQATNRVKVAQKEKIARTAEAQAEAAYIAIVGRSLTSNYLKLREVEARKMLYEKVAAGDKVIVGANSVFPMVGK